MDALKQQFFRELWTDLRATFALDASVNGFLDYLQTKDALIAFAPNWYHLVRQNRAALFEQLGAALAASRDGYDVLLEYVRRDSLRFLYDKYTNQEHARRAHLHAVEKALKYGNVPALPKYYIERVALMHETKEKLLSANRTINVYGMDGAGKTNLIAACLRDDAVLLRANYKVYWIDLDRAAESDLLGRMYGLYHKLRIDDGALADLPADNPGDVDLMRDRLLNLFTRDAYSRALIVLDNVRAGFAKAVECFGVCGMVIISQEKFRTDARVWHKEIHDTFSAAETRQVFEMALEGAPVPNEHLRAIVEWCRGDLTTTVLCADLMEERRTSLLNRENGAKVWKRLKEELLKQDSKVTTKRNTPIALRLEGLKERDGALFAKYWDFAIFVTDVNITSNALALLWGAEVVDVEEIMGKFCDQSFAVKEYNEQIDSYVYGVNHICLNYLKSKHPRLAQTHQKLIDAYRDRYTHYHRFPDDNYIYQYIGYHLEQAAYVDDFEIYRDLRFLEAKIRATGIADVLRDFEIYHEHITRWNPEHERVAKELVEFVERYGQNIERYPHTSILQSALQLPADSAVHRLAFDELKRSDQFGLYFEWTLPKKYKPYIHQLSVKQNLEVACFTFDDPNYLLIGTATGDIQLWDQRYDKILQEFKGHTGRITYLRAAETKFLSIADDGAVKVWKIDDKSRRNSFALNATGNGALSVPSPACIKQKNYQAFFGSSHSVENDDGCRVKDDLIVSADFVDDMLVVGTDKGRLRLYESKVLTFEKDLKTRITAVQFSHNFTYVYAALKADVLVYSASNAEFISKACCKYDILSLHTVQCDAVDEFIVVQARQVLACSIMLQNGNCYDIRKEVIMADMPAANTCSSMTDKYLVVGAGDNRIHMWDLAEKRVAARFDTQDGCDLICIDAMTNLDDRSVEILLTSFQDRSVKLWHVNPEETAIQQAERIDAFAAHWKPSCGDFVVALVRQSRLVILEKNEAKEVDCADVMDIVKVVSFGQAFVFARRNGRVFLWRDGSVSKMMDLKDEVSYLEAPESMVVAATSRGVLFVYHEGSAHKLRVESRADVLDKVKCAFVLAQHLVVVSQRKVSYWGCRFESEEVLYAAAAADFSSGCLSKQSKLCVTFGNNFKIFTFDASATIKIESCIVKKTAHRITACCFSNEGKYLALGTESGDIEVFNAECLTPSSVLKLHSSPVHHLQFSHEEPILLSLAEQMAWWNVKLASMQLAQATTRRSYRSRSNSGRSPGKKPPPLTNLLPLEDMRLADMAMQTKRGRFEKEYLLAAIKLHGASASHVVGADRFRAFLSVDNLGNLYNMRVVDEARLQLSPIV